MGTLQHMADKSDAESFVNRNPSSVGQKHQEKSGFILKKKVYLHLIKLGLLYEGFKLLDKDLNSNHITSNNFLIFVKK